MFIKIKEKFKKSSNNLSNNIKDSNSLIRDIIVLWRISLSNTANLDTNIVPFLLRETYNIDYSNIAKSLIKRKLIIKNKEGFFVLSQQAHNLLQYYNCVVIMAQHPEYSLSLKMFENDLRWHIAPDNDIIWDEFNRRTILYELDHKWEKVRQNHINKAHLLFEEKRYIRSLDEFTVAAFLSTTGIKDDDTVMVYEESNGYMNCSGIRLYPEETTKFLRRIIREKITTIDKIKEIFYSNQFTEHYLKVLPFFYLDIDNSWKLLEEALLCKRNIVFGMADMLCLRIKLQFNLPNENSIYYFYNSLKNQQERARLRQIAYKE